MTEDNKQDNLSGQATVNSKAKGLFSLLKDYKGLIALLIFLTVAANGFSIIIPKVIASAIDGYRQAGFNLSNTILEFSILAVLIFIFTYLQNIVQVYASERSARDLRSEIMSNISKQNYSYIVKTTPARLLTNLTSDVDAVKTFISMAVPSLISSGFLIVGVSILLIMTDARLAFIVLSVVALIAIIFFFIFKKVRPLFIKAQAAIDWLNKVISESIIGAALIRILNSQKEEKDKFWQANTEAKDISFKILDIFSTLMPIINFFAGLAALAIVWFGGRFVIFGSLSLGNFTAFSTYLTLLIFPIIILGFISNLIAQAQASFSRIGRVREAQASGKNGRLKTDLKGKVEFDRVGLSLNGRPVLKDVSFKVLAGQKLAIIGPTAAGKTQLLYLLAGLLSPDSGHILLDGNNIEDYDQSLIHSQLAFVFQDSVMFNISLRENIAFGSGSDAGAIELAIKTAELQDYIESLPQGLETVVSERGTSLSGGQKQRIMLARALALKPKILLLDDFTARVDIRTEKRILDNIINNYPDLTLISVAQKISSIKDYDQIILLMEGELLAKGKHQELLESSPEYVQIYKSQQSTNQYDLSEND